MLLVRPPFRGIRRPGDAHTKANNQLRIPTPAMISPQIRNRILYFHYAFGFTFPMTRIHVRLLGPCSKTGQADHACIRLQSRMSRAKVNSYRQSASHNVLRLPVHTSYAHNSYKPLTASKRLLEVRKNDRNGSWKNQDSKQQGFADPQHLNYHSVTCNPMTGINAAHRQQSKEHTPADRRTDNLT